MAPADQLSVDPARDAPVARDGASGSPAGAEAGSLSGGAGPPRPSFALTRCPKADGDRLIDSATATIRATPLNMSLSQLAPDTSCSPWTPMASTRRLTFPGLCRHRKKIPTP